MDAVDAAVETLLARVQSQVVRRPQPKSLGASIAKLHGIELSGDVARFLQTIDTHRTEDFSEGDPVDLSTYWQLATPADIVAPGGARPFEAAVEYEREHFGNGFGLLQVILPAVPVACLERRDHLFVSLLREEAFVLPQEALFDPEAPPNGPSEAFYSLSRAYFFGREDHCADVVALCHQSRAPVVRDMARVYGALLDGQPGFAGVEMAGMREAIREAGLSLPTRTGTPS